MPLPLRWFNYCYFDTEYYRKDNKEKKIYNKFAAETVDLYSIQFSIFSFDKNFKKSKDPNVQILRIDEHRIEYDILKDFLPIWERFCGAMRSKDRLIPIGYVIGGDIQLIAEKFNYYKNQLKLSTKQIQTIANPFYMIQTSRFIDLAQQSILDTKKLDNTLSELTSNPDLNGLKVRKTIGKMLYDPNMSEKHREEYKDFLTNYINDEFSSSMKLLRKHYSREKGIGKKRTKIITIALWKYLFQLILGIFQEEESNYLTFSLILQKMKAKCNEVGLKLNNKTINYLIGRMREIGFLIREDEGYCLCEDNKRRIESYVNQFFSS